MRERTGSDLREEETTRAPLGQRLRRYQLGIALATALTLAAILMLMTAGPRN
jgi:heme/copper-type cytochrome/quinol oxidase subunit 4